MTTTNGNGRLYDHLGRKPTNKQLADAAIEAAQQVAKKAAADQVQEIVEFYFAQIPELVAGMLARAFEANGIQFKPPPSSETFGGVGQKLLEPSEAEGSGRDYGADLAQLDSAGAASPNDMRIPLSAGTERGSESAASDGLSSSAPNPATED